MVVHAELRELLLSVLSAGSQPWGATTRGCPPGAGVLLTLRWSGEREDFPSFWGMPCLAAPGLTFSPGLASLWGLFV